MTVKLSVTSPVYQKALPQLEVLLDAEEAERLVRSIKYQMKVARFPGYRTWLDLSLHRVWSMKC
jgi:hypothetical protein